MTELRKELTLTRVVNAPRELVFRAWTEPELLVQWWGPRGVTNTDCEIDPRVGGTIRVTMVAGPELGESAGERWPMRGVVTEVVPPEKLVFTDEALDNDGTVILDGVTTVLFEDQGDGTTKVTVHTFGDGRADQADQARPALEGMSQGWTETLDKLAEFAQT